MELEKMEITAYSDPGYKTPTGSGYEMTVKINPETYNVSYSAGGGSGGKDCSKENKKQSGGKTAPVKIVEFSSKDLSFDLWFDGTGAIQGSNEVKKEIDLFKKIALVYNGKIHSTNYLIIHWGKLIFKGQLKSLSLDYQLFRPDGTPLRVKASVAFSGFIDAETKEKMDNTSSPDLSHVKTVRAGDTLPLMCYKIYKDSSYYLEVAEKNGLSNFTNLVPGQQILFPPLGK